MEPDLDNDVSSLSPEEIDALIAEKVMGFVWWRTKQGREMLLDAKELWPGDDYYGCVRIEPGNYATVDLSHNKYSTDLNACFEAQAKCIEKVGWRVFWRTLGEAVDDGPSLDGSVQGGDYIVDRMIIASAYNRCLAMLKALGVESAAQAQPTMATSQPTTSEAGIPNPGPNKEGEGQ